MSEHSEIVRDYIELRNFLAVSHPRPNMHFDVGFVIENKSLLAFSSASKSSIEVAKIQPQYFRLYLPHYDLRFGHYCESLTRFVNSHYKTPTENSKSSLERIIFFAHQHKRSLDLKVAYEPKS